jgi:hypothetical protein
MANQIGDYFFDQLDQRRKDVAGRVRDAAETLRQAGQGLETSGLGGSSGTAVFNRGADMVDRAGSYIENNDLDVLLADAEDFARRRPWTMAAIGMTAGLLASRVVKSTAARRSANGNQ